MPRFDWHVSANPDIVFLDPNLTPSESGIDGASVPTSGMGAESTDGKMYMTCFNNPINPEYDYDTELYPMYSDVICFRPDQVPLKRQDHGDHPGLGRRPLLPRSATSSSSTTPVP